jgi:hypothetical protein
LRLLLVPLLLLLAAGSVAADEWTCPACSTLADADACPECGLLRPPEGMAYVPATEVDLWGERVAVEPFLIDSSPTTYRKVMPWLNESLTSMEELAENVVGQYDPEGQFLKFTPFIVGESGGGLTVPTDCFSQPAASLTWTGAVRYLRSRGARLPRFAELAAAARHGIIEPVDVYAVMSTYAQVIERNLGMLGAIGSQAIFTYGEGAELSMWEWTEDAWGQSPGGPVDMDDPYRTLFRAAEQMQRGVARKSTGYFNVTFRGAMPVSPELHSEGETL